MKMFPIQKSIIFKAIPWGVIETCESQAQHNHGQTIGRLAERGGLSPAEAVAVIEGEAYDKYWPYRFTPTCGIAMGDEQLLVIVSKYITGLGIYA